VKAYIMLPPGASLSSVLDTTSTPVDLKNEFHADGTVTHTAPNGDTITYTLLKFVQGTGYLTDHTWEITIA